MDNSNSDISASQSQRSQHQQINKRSINQNYHKQQDDSKAKRNYLLYLRELTFKNPSQNQKMRYILYYKLADKPKIEVSLKNIIEIPFERNETIESIEFQLQAICADEEEQIVCNSKFYLYQLDLTEMSQVGTFTVRFKSENSELQNYEFALIFDASIIMTSQEGAHQDDTKRGKFVQQEENDEQEEIGIFTGNIIKDQKEFLKFKNKRQDDQVKSNKYIMNSGKLSNSYKLEFRLLKQKYEIWMEDPEIDDLFFFYINTVSEKYGKQEISVDFKEVISETIVLNEFDDNFDGNQQQKQISKEVIDEEVIASVSQEVLDLFVEGNQESKLVFSIWGDFKIDVKFTSIQNSSYHKKFLGFTTVKILETRLFSTNIEPTHAEVNLNSIDDDLPTQTWKIKPFQNYLGNQDLVSLWDFEHNTVYKNKKQKVSENEDAEMEINDLQYQFNTDFDKQNIVYKTVLENGEECSQDEDFNIQLESYVFINKYSEILEESEDRSDIKFSQRQNHIFFKTVSPFDYISFQLYIKDQMIGYYEESFFKLPENQLILGYIVKSINGRVKIKFLEEGEKDDYMDDDELDQIIGTIKLVIDHIGYNNQILPKNEWVKDLENLNQDDDKLVDIIKKGIKNYPVQLGKMFVFRLELKEIWNILDLVCQNLQNSKVLEIKVMMGKFKYVLPFQIEKIQGKDFKNSSVLKEFQLQKRSVVQYDEQNINIYCRNEKQIFKLSCSLDLTENLMFQIKSMLDNFIFEMKILPQNVTLSYQTQQLRQCYFFQDKGFLLIPVKIPTKIPQNKKIGEHFNEILQQDDNIVTQNQEDIFNTISHLKFSYKFLENELEEEEEDFENEEFGTKKGFYQIALFQPQILLQNSEKNKAKRLSNYVYQLQIEDLEQDINPKKQKNFIKKQVIFDNSINKYTSELIEKAEFLKEGNALNDNSLVLKLNLVLKRLYSDDVNQDEQEPEIVWEKRIYINQPKNSLDYKFMIETKKNKVQLLSLKPNSVIDYPVEFYEDSLNLNLSLNLQISMKQNPFINNPNSKVFIAFSQEMEQLMQSTQILEKSSQIKLTYSTLSREAQKEKMSKQKEIYYCGGSKKNKNNKGINEVEFQGYHNTDYILVEIDNGNNQVETGMIKLNNLVLLPAEKELINSHQNSQQSRNNNINENLNNNMSQLEMEESQAFQSQNGDEINEMEKKKVYEPELEDYYWSFINIQNKQFQFLIRFKNPALAISSIQKSQNQSINEGKSVKTAGAQSVKSQFSIKKQNQQMEPETVKIKKQIQQQKLQNNLLVTQLQKERKDLIKKNKQMNELVKIVKINEQPENLKEKKNNEIKKKIRKKVELSEQGKKARELFQNQCICLEGIVVKFGFCENCLKEIKEKYDKQLLEYKNDADKYEDVYIKNFNIDHKMELLKRKIQNYKNKTLGIDIDEEDAEEKQLIDQINYYKKSIKIEEDQIIMLTQDHKRQVQEKKELQFELEKKISQKSQKLEYLAEQIEKEENNIQLIMNRLEKQQQKLAKLKDENQ